MEDWQQTLCCSQGGLDSEKLPSWLRIKKKMGVRGLLSDIKHKLREAIIIGLTQAESPQWQDSDTF